MPLLNSLKLWDEKLATASDRVNTEYILKERE